MPLAALVSPASDLSRAEYVRYARQIALPHIGVDGQRRLKNARVLVLGAGGLGSPVLQYLAAAGVGTLGIADADAVDVSNLQRQTIHSSDSVGLRKTASAAAAVSDINPLVDIVEHDAEVTTATVLDLVADYDVVVDGTDNFEVQYAVDAACALLGKPYVWGSVLRFDGQVTVFWATAPDGLDRTLGDLYPEQPVADADESCAVAGVLGPLCATIGSMMATETLKLLGGYGDPLLGRLLVHDALDASWTDVEFGHAAASGHENAHTEASPMEEGRRMTDPTTSADDADRDYVTAPELSELLAARERGETDFVLVDVREPNEYELVSIDGAQLVPLGEILSGAAREELPAPGETVIVHCHFDGRSRKAAEALKQNGWENVRFVQGGIDAWSTEVDPSKPRY
jgi:adenylyltransferase/sulfurtransferase